VDTDTGENREQNGNTDKQATKETEREEAVADKLKLWGGGVAAIQLLRDERKLEVGRRRRSQTRNSKRQLPEHKHNNNNNNNQKTQGLQ
jgi:NADH dehydrogenase FAD-containing subunit